MDPRTLWKRPESRFLILFLSILGISFTVIALRPVNDAFVVPYTTLIARVSGNILGLLGEDITINGCVLRSPRFAVTIYNGCNGLITSLIFVSGVLAFPARWSAKIIGVVGGIRVCGINTVKRLLVEEGMDLEGARELVATARDEAALAAVDRLLELEPENPAYNVPLAFRLRGELDPTHFESALNGSDALKIMQSSPVDLVVTDIRMPGMDGYEATRAIRRDDGFATLPVITMSAPRFRASTIPWIRIWHPRSEKNGVGATCRALSARLPVIPRARTGAPRRPGRPRGGCAERRRSPVRQSSPPVPR